MKIIKINSFYLDFFNAFYSLPGRASLSFAEQKRLISETGFAWFGVWEREAKPVGIEFLEIVHNSDRLQRKWAKESGIDLTDARKITLLQIDIFKPDIIWYDSTDTILFEMICDRFSHCFKIGWVGSAIFDLGLYKKMNLVLSCAPESVEQLRLHGIKSERLDHAFDAKILDRIRYRKKHIPTLFVGQIATRNQMHTIREELLADILAKTNVKILSNSRIPITQYIKDCLKHSLRKSLLKFNSESCVRFGKEKPLSFQLFRKLSPPLYGLEMLQMISESFITLNIHADSSPRFASNMRLFEITGVGTCMVVDNKENINEFFRPDQEVVTYSSSKDCVDKICWLLKNKGECERISANGQKRTLNEHTFSKRTLQLRAILEKNF